MAISDILRCPERCGPGASTPASTLPPRSANPWHVSLKLAACCNTQQLHVVGWPLFPPKTVLYYSPMFFTGKGMHLWRLLCLRNCFFWRVMLFNIAPALLFALFIFFCIARTWPMALCLHPTCTDSLYCLPPGSCKHTQPIELSCLGSLFLSPFLMTV